MSVQGDSIIPVGNSSDDWRRGLTEVFGVPGGIWTWVWMGLAVALMVGEMLTAGFVLLPWGIGAAVAALLSILGVALGWQWVAFLVVSILSIALVRKFAHRITTEPGIKTGSARHIGETGIVIEELTDHGGIVRVGREEWRADAGQFEPVAVGTKVIVTAIEGTHLVVHPAEQSAAEIDPTEGGTRA